MTALRFAGVTLSLGGRPVLRGVDLALREGELLALAGRNGAGKTSLLRAAARLVVPDAGTLEVHGRPLAALPRRALAREIAFVAQETSVSFPFSVEEVALMGRAPHLGLLGFEGREDRRKVREALERLGIGHLAERSVLEVSGGERQLAMVARALVQDARILLLDEPTSHLDLCRRLELLGLVRELVAEGRSALVVSHDVGLAARFSDRLALLADGRVAALGAPAEVLDPAHLRAVFGIEAEVLHSSDGVPVVVPRLAAGSTPRTC